MGADGARQRDTAELLEALAAVRRLLAWELDLDLEGWCGMQGESDEGVARKLDAVGRVLMATGAALRRGVYGDSDLSVRAVAGATWLLRVECEGPIAERAARSERPAAPDRSAGGVPASAGAPGVVATEFTVGLTGVPAQWEFWKIRKVVQQLARLGKGETVFVVDERGRGDGYQRVKLATAAAAERLVRAIGTGVKTGSIHIGLGPAAGPERAGAKERADRAARVNAKVADARAAEARATEAAAAERSAAASTAALAAASVTDVAAAAVAARGRPGGGQAAGR